MNRAELRRAMRRKRAELKAALRRAQEANRARLEQNSALRKQRVRRRMRNGALVALGLLFVLLGRCGCARPPPAPPTVERQEEPAPPAPPQVPAPAPKAKRKLQASMEPQRRGSYAGIAPAPPTWVDDFRLQVAARSSRLAGCFTGAERPGALRWRASVNAESGAVFDHELEPLAASAPLGRRERDCVVAALSSPPYKLVGVPAPAEGVPNRVSIVIEF